MIENGTTAQQRLPAGLVGGHEPVGIEEELQPGPVGDPVPRLAVVYGWGPGTQCTASLIVSMSARVVVIDQPPVRPFSSPRSQPAGSAARVFGHTPHG